MYVNKQQFGRYDACVVCCRDIYWRKYANQLTTANLLSFIMIAFVNDYIRQQFCVWYIPAVLP